MARVIEGDDIFDPEKVRVSDEVVAVKEILGPLMAEDITCIRCVGLNYAKHSTWLLRYRG